jgi:hypothetical protein
VALAAEQPSPQGLRRLEHEYSLAAENLGSFGCHGVRSRVCKRISEYQLLIESYEKAQSVAMQSVNA